MIGVDGWLDVIMRVFGSFLFDCFFFSEVGIKVII